MPGKPEVIETLSGSVHPLARPARRELRTRRETGVTVDLEAVRQQFRQRNFEAFRIVCETGSVTRAAERLALSQPAVSQLIGRLERAFGFRLFERGVGRRLRPTPQARAIYLDVCGTLDAMARLEATAAALVEPRPAADGGPALSRECAPA